MLVNWYTQTDYPQIRLEVLWIFTNLTSVSRQFSDQLVGKNVMVALCEDLVTGCQAIQYQAIWAVGNVAADDHKYRD